MDTVAGQPVEELLDLVAEEKRTRLRRFHRREDLLRGLWAELLLRSLIIEEVRLPNAEIVFEFGPNGKPRLSGADHFHFNISHSGNWVACMVDSQPVGVDVEQIQAYDEALTRSLFAEEEYRYITESSDPESRQFRFYQIWTAKESYIKAIGTGLSLPLHSFSLITPEGVEGVKRIQDEDWLLQSYPLDPAYSLMSCSKSARTWESFQRMQPQAIIERVRSVPS
ncbi:4'-phosphopantetheinyl transferase superfamily protein [Paenibacillus sp. HWE-109]|uniref:4'-phosphopantetheinyl transferase family protein n=1 Tax=Paenibacillus sp. HWE-109 TaxID=1306526 RepID=UPI001EE1542E|nr:4'-phosphopantetheinyl transferase superfamily protein [Paenibacillus sp. HWE-109]UKS31243.1 4'-phosphopantetheinyl transferase superfamily protein [Paenibacillus sp. HWE-109]